MGRPTYQIAELREDQEGGYSPRGGALELWKTKHHEVMLSGPAETGKTWASCQKLNALLWKYPGAQAVIARKVRSTMFGSVLQTYARVAAPSGWDDSPIKRYGGETPEWYDYPNGSRLWVAGLDNPGKALSSERAFVYINQAEEILLNDWETLLTRCTGRGVDTPYVQVFGDCNPGPPTHWILHRPSLKLIHTNHRDNPTLYTDAGEITEQGKRTITILSSLTGLRRDRLYLGKWVQAEGAIFEQYDASVHLLSRTSPLLPKRFQRYIWVVDFGYTNPFVWTERGIDSDGRMYLVREIYQTKLQVADAMTMILLEVAEGYAEGWRRPEAIVTDHDAEDRATFEDYCWLCKTCRKAVRKDDASLHKSQGHDLQFFNLATTPAYKAVSPGIQAKQERLKIAGDGRPRFYYVEESLIHEPDPALIEEKLPTCTAAEIEGYVWEPPKDGRAAKEVPRKKDDHGQDTDRYGVCYLDGIEEEQKEKPAKKVPYNPLGAFGGVSLAGSPRTPSPPSTPGNRPLFARRTDGRR